jgi:O-succinylbenzoate synthase
MKIEGVEVHVLGLALGMPIQSAGVLHSNKPTLLVKVTTDQGAGWGECSAYPDARFPDPTLDAVEPTVVDRVVRRLFDVCGDGSVPAADSVALACAGDGSVAEQSIAAALEMAVLDVELCASGQSLASRLGVTRGQVETGAVVGIPEGRDVGMLVDSVAAALGTGARRVRVKIEPDWDHVPLGAIRERFGDVVLHADANGSFDVDAPEWLAGLDQYGLRCLEQPFDPRDLDAHRALSESMATPIALDESLWSLARVREALRSGACRVACLKPGRLGGVVATLAAAAACAAAGVDCFMGGFFETGLGRALNAALAGRPEFGLPGDLGDPDQYLEVNPCPYLDTDAGLVTLSDRPGLGAAVSAEALRALAVDVRWLPFSRR